MEGAVEHAANSTAEPALRAGSRPPFLSGPHQATSHIGHGPRHCHCHSCQAGWLTGQSFPNSQQSSQQPAALSQPALQPASLTQHPEWPLTTAVECACECTVVLSLTSCALQPHKCHPCHEWRERDTCKPGLGNSVGTAWGITHVQQPCNTCSSSGSSSPPGRCGAARRGTVHVRRRQAQCCPGAHLVGAVAAAERLLVWEWEENHAVPAVVAALRAL